MKLKDSQTDPDCVYAQAELVVTVRTNYKASFSHGTTNVVQGERVQFWESNSTIFIFMLLFCLGINSDRKEFASP